jgi:hypothetical protein
LTGHQFEIPENDIEVLDDNVRFLTSDNNELRVKIKDLSIQNSKLKVRVIELNEIVINYSNKNGD